MNDVARMTLQWRVFDSAAAVSAAAAAQIAACAAHALARAACFRIVLAGGRTPLETYARLRTIETDWSRWEFFFSDERCVARDHPDRNSRAARAALLDHVPTEAAQIHEIPVELGMAVAVAQYADVVRAHSPFDLVLLGVGEDGHTASLFPARPWHADDWVCSVSDAPKPPPSRVSLGLRALRASAQVLALACGPDKAVACRDWYTGGMSPIGQATAGKAGYAFVDHAALPEGLRDA